MRDRPELTGGAGLAGLWEGNNQLNNGMARFLESRSGERVLSPVSR
jgi:hypothetical protein